MKRPVLHQLIIFCLAVSTFFFAAQFAQANTFTFPQQFNYPGLTFSAPLTFSHSPMLPHPTEKLTFSQQNKLRLNKNTDKKPLEAIVLTPTLSETTDITPAPTESLPDSTPTVSTQDQVNLETTETADRAVSSTPEPTIQPTLTSTPPAYSPAPQANPGGLNAADIFTMVNTYRASQGLPAFQKDAKTCSLAAERAPEVSGEVASGNMHAGLEAMNLPYWNTENIISMNSDQAAFNWWINDPIHHEAIVGNFTYSCVACSGNSCAEEFTSYQPK